MNTTRPTPKQQQLHESTAGEEDPGAGLDAAESAIKPDGVAPSAAGQPARSERPAPGGTPAPDRTGAQK